MPESEVHLWIADHRVGAVELDGHAALLDAGERQRAARFRFHKDFRRFVFGHARVRSILGLYSGRRPEELSIARRCQTCGSDEHGKPFLTEPTGAPSPIRFSCSYSAHLVVIAVARGAEVGADVETVDARFAWREVAGTALSPAERSRLDALDGDAAPGAFYGIWTRKEAVSKVSGEGLNQLTQMDTCGWTYGEGGAFGLSDRSGERSWVGQVLELPGHAAAVAVEGTSAPAWSVKESPRESLLLDKGA